MCLETVDFAMKWDEKLQQYVGYGWKRGYPRDSNRWLKATGKIYVNGDGSTSEGEVKIPNIYSEDAKEYPAGFHIFLKKEDAERYDCFSGPAYRVAFTNVVAFGENHVRYTYNSSYSLYSVKSSITGPCVIAQYMWVFDEGNE